MRIALAAKVKEVNFVEGVAEEAGAEALEFFDRIGGVEAGGCRFGGGVGGEVFGYPGGGGGGGVDDVHGVVEFGEGPLDKGLEQRVMGAAKEQGLGVRGFGEGFVEIDAEDFGRHVVVDPAFFYKRYEQGAGFFDGGEADCVQGFGVGVGLGGGRGGKDENGG